MVFHDWRFYAKMRKKPRIISQWDIFPSACREEQLLTEDAIRIYHCTKFSILVLAT
jgi:hypothetical protein